VEFKGSGEHALKVERGGASTDASGTSSGLGAGIEGQEELRFRVINLVDSLTRLNFGIWNAAINTAPLLAQNHSVGSQLWYPAESAEEVTLPNGVESVPLKGTSLSVLRDMAKRLNPATDIIVTHGAWRYPTRWGAWLRRKGFRWVYVPHGMLEPWSLTQKAAKKAVYWRLIEGPLTKKAAGIRAVGQPERTNLLMRYRSVIFIPNGHSARVVNFVRPIKPVQYLFLSRFHPKKRVSQLVEAWLNSTLAGDPAYRLLLAGPDEGELKRIQLLLEAESKSGKSSNVVVSEPVYGLAKEQLLRGSHFFCLPSLSEGFPTSVVEALSEGLIPLISRGCNFPEAFEQGIATDTGTELATIQKALESAAALNNTQRQEVSNRGRQFAVTNYSLEVVARHQAFWYAALLGLHSAQPKREEHTFYDLDDELQNI
jgi:glycosyltransferase involved in cell wall biosynthesis